MRLIDADVIEINEECALSGKGIKAFLDAIPTAYDADKVVEQLEEKARGRWGYPSVMELDDVIRIVKSGGID